MKKKMRGRPKKNRFLQFPYMVLNRVTYNWVEGLTLSVVCPFFFSAYCVLVLHTMGVGQKMFLVLPKIDKSKPHVRLCYESGLHFSEAFLSHRDAGGRIDCSSRQI
jgi:hypothetical protein